MNVVEVKTTIHINANLSSCDALIIRKGVEHCLFIVDLNLY